MKLLKIILSAILLSVSLACSAWEVQQNRICSGVGLHAEKYILCFPEHSVDFITKDEIGIVSKSKKPRIVFFFNDYEKLLEVDQEGGLNKYKGKTSIDGEIVYIHHFTFPESDYKTYKWTYVVEEGELYMQIIGLSEKDVAALFSEIMKSKKLY